LSLRAIRAAGAEPVDAASIAVFRATVGLLLAIEMGRFFLHGWIDSRLLAPTFLFKYPGFGWVAPPPGDGLYWVFAALGILSVMVAVGLFYRVAVVTLFLGFGYVFLLEQANYLNQYYLVLCVLALLCCMPAERAWSVDRWRRPPATATTVPRWNVWALRAQFEVVLVYAGLVKLNADWLAGQPLEIWLDVYADLPGIGEWLGSRQTALLASYGALALHLIGAPLLLWRPARLPVFLLYVAFHVANSMLFRIGLFPWITLAGTLLFFDPDWPRRLWSHLAAQPAGQPAVRSPARQVDESSWPRRLVVLLLIAQILVPSRGLFYPGRASWTGEGQWFAWRMKLDEKACTARFLVHDDRGMRAAVAPESLLSPRQAAIMAKNPDLALQFAHFLRDRGIAAGGGPTVRVTADVCCALNGRPAARLIDPAVDLASATRHPGRYDWVLPLAPGDAGDVASCRAD
jgi:hypothetical protein